MGQNRDSKYKWIKESGRIEKGNDCYILEKINSMESSTSKQVYVVAFYSNSIKAILKKEDFIGENNFDFSHLLELRVFNEDSELKISRPDINSDFVMRITKEIDLNSDSEWFILEEEQYLDIDDKESEVSEDGKKVIVQATGGGKYELPFNSIEDIKNIKLKICNYYMYNESGQAIMTDWRIVGFNK